MPAKKESFLIWLEAFKKTKGKEFVGVSKMGGDAGLPKLFPWPSFAKEDFDYDLKTNVLKKKERLVPLRYLAQISCAELPLALFKQGFPKTGMLYFFIEEKEDEDFDEDKDHFRIVYADVPASRLAPHAQPKIPDVNISDLAAYREGRMTFVPAPAVPGPKKDKKYDRVGGQAEWVQGGELPEKEENAWTLLLQFETARGDEPTLYFLIPTADLKKCDMRNARCFFQCM